MRRDRRIQGQISKAFRRSENQLLKALRKRKAEVMVSTKLRLYSIFVYWYYICVLVLGNVKWFKCVRPCVCVCVHVFMYRDIA